MTVYTTGSLTTAYSNFSSALPGDIVQLTPGVYSQSGRKNLTKSTTGVVTFRSQYPQAAIIKGDPIDIGSQNTIFEGFDLQFDIGSQNDVTIVSINGNNSIYTRNRIHFLNPGTSSLEQCWVQSKANDVEFSYNEVYNKTCVDDMFLASKNSTTPITGNRVLHNWFHHFTQNPADTQSEVVRIGESAMAMVDFNAEVAYNKVSDCDADTEVYSIKASGVNVHHNNILDAGGSIVLRQAHDCLVRNNVIKGGGGIRFYGHGHIIELNQILDNDESGGVNSCLFIGSADRPEYVTVQGGSTPAVPGQVIGLNNHYAQTKDNIIKWNIISNGSSDNDNLILLGNDAADLYQPINNTFEDNIILASTGTMTHAITGTNPASWAAQTSLQRNVMRPTGTATIGDIPSSAYTNVDLQLQRHPDGTYRCVFALSPKEVGVEADISTS